MPSFPEIYNKFLKQGFKPHQASIKAHAIIREHADANRSDSDEEDSDDEKDSRRVISKKLEQMKMEVAKLSNHYKQDKKLPYLINYINRVLKFY
jgi:hypothetical protein